MYYSKKNELNQNQRQSGIELLRILAMLGIVLSHWGGHGSWQLDYDNTYLVNKVFLQLTQYMGEVGNCVFVLITGYFLATKSEVNKKGLIRVITDVKFYAFVIWLTVVICKFVPYSIVGCVQAIFSIIYTQYWFVIPYIIVVLLAPWINLILAQASKKALYYYFGILVAVEIFLPLIKAPTVSSNLGVFILFYSIGNILRTNPLTIFTKKYMSWLLLGCGRLSENS